MTAPLWTAQVSSGHVVAEIIVPLGDDRVEDAIRKENEHIDDHEGRIAGNCHIVLHTHAAGPAEGYENGEGSARVIVPITQTQAHYYYGQNEDEQVGHTDERSQAARTSSGHFSFVSVRAVGSKRGIAVGQFGSWLRRGLVWLVSNLQATVHTRESPWQGEMRLCSVVASCGATPVTR